MDNIFASVDTLKTLLEIAVMRYGDNDMLHFRSADRGSMTKLSYSEFHQRAERVGARLLSKGYEHRNIAIISENSYEWFLAFFAITASGNTAVLINKSLPLDYIKELILFNSVSAAYVSADYADDIRVICSDNPIEVLDTSQLNEIAETEQSAEALAYFRHYPVLPADRAVIAFTSGTTGVQKGVMLSHLNLISDASACSESTYDIKRLITGLPLFHMFGLMVYLVTFLLGATAIINSSLRYFTKDVIREKPNYLTVIPALLPTLHALYSQMPPTEETTIICGGAAVGPEWAQKFESLRVNFRAGYGMTECSPVISLSERGTSYDGYMLVHSIFELRLNEPDPNGIGEILIRGAGVTSGYYRMEKETAEILVGQWLHTGDLGQMKDDRHVAVVGRKKNLLVLANGENISPEFIEQKLMSAPGIRECLVSESADGLLQAEIYAPDCAADAVEDYVQAYNRSCPSSDRIMKIVLRTEEFAKNALGKILRNT